MTDGHFSLEQAMHQYTRLCRVRDPETARANRDSGLDLILEALIQQGGRPWTALCAVQTQGEITARDLVAAASDDFVITTASYLLKSLWALTVEPVRDQGEVRLLFERRAVKLPAGGRQHWYRLSALGTQVMARRLTPLPKEGCPCQRS